MEETSGVVVKRGSILNDALRIINGERQNQYGNPEDSFAIIASLWRTYLTARNVKRIRISSKDVAMMMTLMKIAREVGGSGKADNFIDAAGYIGLAADMSDDSDSTSDEK